jgi:hypothetical protein
MKILFKERGRTILESKDDHNSFGTISLTYYFYKEKCVENSSM